MSNVFVVSEYVDAEQNSTGFFWSRIIKRVGGEYGHVSVIYPEPAMLPAESVDAMVNKLPFYAPRFNKNKLSARVFGQVCQIVGFCWRIVRHVKKGDVVMTGTNPALLLMILPLLKRLKGFKWGVLVHDVFPENLVPAGVIKSDGCLYPIIKRLFSVVYDSADLLIVIGRDMQELVAQKVRNPSKVVYVSNWADETEVYPLPRGEVPFIEKMGWQNKVVFQFFGNIGRLQGIENILDAISLVGDGRAAFLFMGEGALVPKVQEFISAYPSRNVAYAGAVPLKDKNLGLAAGDVALISLENGMLGLGVPSKAYFSLAADKPLLAIMDERAEISRVIRETGVGWQCGPSKPQDLADLIIEICAIDFAPLSGRSRSVFLKTYSETPVLNKFIDSLTPLVELQKS